MTTSCHDNQLFDSKIWNIQCFCFFMINPQTLSCACALVSGYAAFLRKSHLIFLRPGPGSGGVEAEEEERVLTTDNEEDGE